MESFSLSQDLSLLPCLPRENRIIALASTFLMMGGIKTSFGDGSVVAERGIEKTDGGARRKKTDN